VCAKVLQNVKSEKSEVESEDVVNDRLLVLMYPSTRMIPTQHEVEGFLALPYWVMWGWCCDGDETRDIASGLWLSPRELETCS
jgi:hypothetical protein